MLEESPTSKLKYIWAAYLVLYVVVKTIFIFSGHDLYSEESQYWLWSQHLDWSYYSKPPLIAWINFTTQELFGHSDLVIRITALGFGLATLVIYYFVAMEMFQDKRIAIIAILVLSISPYFVLASTFFTTDSLLLFFWTLTLFLFLKGLKSESITMWLWAGMTLGLGCLSKYSMVFFVIFLLIPFLWEANRVNYFKKLLAISIVALLVNLPVIWWNYTHDWISVKHVNTLATGTGKGFDFIKSLRYAGEFLGGIILVNSPFFAVLLFKGFRQWRNSPGYMERQKMALLMAPVAGTVLVFFVVSIFTSVEVNWLSMAYLSFPMLAGCFVVRYEQYRLLVITSAITAVLIFFLLFPRLQDKIGLSAVIPFEFDSMKRMAGWKELSEKVKELKATYETAGCVFIFTHSYHIASSVSFYIDTENVFCIEFNRRRNQFDLWKSINQYEDTNCYGIYVADETLPDEIKNVFESEITHVSVPVHYRGHLVRHFNIYVLKNFSGWHNPPLATF